MCLTLELEENGTWRVRDHPGQVLIPPPKDNGSKKAESQVGEGEGDKVEEEGKVEKVGDVNEVVDKLEDLEVEDEIPEKIQESTITTPTSLIASTSSISPSSPSVIVTASTSTLPPPPASTSTLEEPTPSTSSNLDESTQPEDEDSGSDSDAESTSSSGSWITPANIHSHKVRDLGLFAAPSKSSTPKPKTILKAALLTGDFAMQNVGLQMGLNVLGSGGKRVKEVRTWVLRCHACFKSVSFSLKVSNGVIDVWV